MITRKTKEALRRESTLLARHAAELRQTGRAWIKRAAEVQRESDVALRHSMRIRRSDIR